VSTTDRYGLALTTDSVEASDHFVEAMDRVLALRSGAQPLLEAAVMIDDEFALAWSMLGGQLRLAGDIAGGNAMIERATTLADGVTERERGHLRVMSLFSRSQFAEARTAAVTHLGSWPGDVVILMYAHYLFNLFTPDPDRRARHLELASTVAAQQPDDWYILGELAFATEESGQYVEARELAERSLRLNPHNGAAAHPLAHAFLETGAVVEGSEWLETWLSQWDDPSPMACHLTWHLALLRLVDGESVMDDLDDVLAYVGRSAGVLTDGASLMWRLSLAGHTDLPWDVLADVPSPPGFSFSNFHRAFVLAGLHDLEGLSQYGHELRDRAAAGHPTAGTCAAVVEALRSFAEDDTTAAANGLIEIEPSLASLGGSRAQLEVLDDTIIEALRRSGRNADARKRLERRLRRRPSNRDRDWLGSAPSLGGQT
jgi:tetratricopeptide (TPR) repeat protein